MNVPELSPRHCARPALPFPPRSPVSAPDTPTPTTRTQGQGRGEARRKRAEHTPQDRPGAFIGDTEGWLSPAGAHVPVHGGRSR